MKEECDFLHPNIFQINYVIIVFPMVLEVVSRDSGKRHKDFGPLFDTFRAGLF